MLMSLKMKTIKSDEITDIVVQICGKHLKFDGSQLSSEILKRLETVIAAILLIMTKNNSRNAAKLLNETVVIDVEKILLRYANKDKG